jgi:hypothetical protein
MYLSVSKVGFPMQLLVYRTWDFANGAPKKTQPVSLRQNKNSL